LQERRTLELELQAALKEEEFELYYQPILSLRTNSICGFEALIRWHHPSRGLLQPGDFITTAEESGLIIPIGEWVLREACRQAATWPKDLKVAVNLSSVQFRRGDLLAMVTSAVTAAGLNPERLELELTETAILQDEDSVRAVLRQLRNLGISLAMDDFGTGYSSLSYLRSFPFSKIKIDRSFVSELSAKGDSLAIVQATLSLAAKMGLVATAEGVETAEQSEALRLEGCDELQGYYIGRPLPAHQVSRVVADFEGKKPPTLRVIR
jgi:EAL domain-containing protein (putative c-di-GMP-specific phosphodiesterase class I)